MVKFLIITQPRSGSAWFMSCLDSHPQIHCPRLPTLFSKHNVSPIKGFKPRWLQVDKPISPYYQYRSRSFKRQIAHRVNRKKLVYEFLSDLYADHLQADAVGFKVNYSQLSKYSEIVSWVKENDVKIIHLMRTNLLKRLVSHKIANTRNLCHSTRSVEPIKVHIDPEVLIADFHRRQKRYARYKKRFINVYNVPYLEVSYESLVADFDAEIHKVLKFLEIDKLLALSSEFVKVNPDSLEDIVENYGDVKQTLSNTEFEKFLD
jgi:LPS sulfotransferase NodH